MIKLFLIISLLFFNIIQVWTFAINLEENDNSNLKSINETNRFDQYWTYENLNAIGNESIIYFKPLDNSSNYVDDKKISLNLNKNESSLTSKTVFSFDLIKVCDCMQIIKENEMMYFNYVFTFEDIKCFDNQIIYNHYLYENIFDVHRFFNIKFSDLPAAGKRKINGLLYFLNLEIIASKDDKEYLKEVYDQVFLYKQLSSNEKLILNKEEHNLFNTVMKSLMNGQFSLRNCLFQQNIEDWLWDVNRSNYRLRTPKSKNQFCFSRTFVVPLKCNDKNYLVEKLKAIFNQLSRDGNNPVKDFLLNLDKKSCESGIDQFYEEFPDFKASQTCRTNRDG